MNIRFTSKNNSLAGMNNVRAALEASGHNVKRLRANSSYTGQDATILWGYVQPEDRVQATPTINNYEAVGIAGNKLRTFGKLQRNIPQFIPEFTTDVTLATQWVDEGATVYARETLTGHSGEGIKVITPNGADGFNLWEDGNTREVGSLPQAQLYVKGANVKHEYRVHVVRTGATYDTLVQRKARLNTDQEHSPVRNHENYHFVNDFTASQTYKDLLKQLAARSVELLGLDFGAVDIVVTHEADIKVLEVNTAPGVSAPRVVDFYATRLATLVDHMMGI